IDVINDRFGTEFTDADQLFFDQILEAASSDESLKEVAQANPEDKFTLVFAKVLESLFVERMEQNQEIFSRFMNDREFQGSVSEWLSREAYKRLRQSASVGD